MKKLTTTQIKNTVITLGSVIGASGVILGAIGAMWGNVMSPYEDRVYALEARVDSVESRVDEELMLLKILIMRIEIMSLINTDRGVGSRKRVILELYDEYTKAGGDKYIEFEMEQYLTSIKGV